MRWAIAIGQRRKKGRDRNRKMWRGTEGHKFPGKLEAKWDVDGRYV